MESIFSLVAMVILLLGGGSGDMLDTVSTDAFWKARDIVPTVESMRAAIEQKPTQFGDVSADIEKLGSADFKVRQAARKALEEKGSAIADQLKKGTTNKDPEIAGTCKEILTQLATTGQADRVNKLMAIRTLGEMKDKSSVDLLKSLTASKELFVADYAARALDQIAGVPHPAKPASIDDDINLLPKETGMVGQVRWGGGEAFSLATLVSRYRLSQARPSELLRAVFESKKMVETLTKRLTQVTDQTGNFRIDGLTVGASKDVGDNVGWVVVVVRGLYDHQAALAALKAQHLDAEQVDDVATVKLPGDDGIFLFPSDDLLVYINGANQAQIGLSREAMAKALKTGKGDFPQNAEMAALLKQVNTTKDVWALVQVPAVIKDEIEFLQPFDVLTLEATRDKGTVTYQIKGAGPDAAKIKDALAALDNDLKTALNEMKQEAARGEGQTAALKAGIKALEAMKLAATGKSATLDGKIEPMNLITGLLGEFPLEEWLGGEENVPDDTLPGGPNVIPPPNGPGMVPPAMPQG